MLVNRRLARADIPIAMELSIEQFANIVKCLGLVESERAKGSELRRAPRAHYRARVRIIPVLEGVEQTAVSVWLRDVSARGLCFIHSQPMRAGSQILAAFPDESGGQTLMLCLVAQCRMLSKDAFSIGAEFTCRVPRPSERSIQSEYDRIRQSILD